MTLYLIAKPQESGAYSCHGCCSLFAVDPPALSLLGTMWINFALNLQYTWLPTLQNLGVGIALHAASLLHQYQNVPCH